MTKPIEGYSPVEEGAIDDQEEKYTSLENHVATEAHCLFKAHRI